MDSKILMTEKVENKERKFGSQLEYYPCKIITPSGEANALFTKNQIEVAIERAARNPEDIPQDISFFDFLFGS